MMPTVEVVWRHLLDGARHGRRRWPSVTAVAAELDAAISTVHRSLSHPVEIGAVSVTALGGLQVLDPARLLVLFAAHRHVQRDIVRRFRVDLPASEIETFGECRNIARSERAGRRSGLWRGMVRKRSGRGIHHGRAEAREN